MAQDLGVHKEALRSWVCQAEADTGKRRDRLTSAEREEIVALRKECARVASRERDIEGGERVFRAGA
jgi:transposase